MTAAVGALAGGAAEGAGGSLLGSLGSSMFFAKAGSSMAGAWSAGFTSAYASNQLFHQMPRGSEEAFKSFGGAAGGSFVGAFKSAVSGQMPDVLKIFDSFEDSAMKIFAAAGTLSGIGIPIVKAFEYAKPAFDAFKALGFEWIEMLTQIGDEYTGLERHLAATNLTPQIKGLSEAVRELAASGAAVSFGAAAEAIGQLDAQIKGMSLEQLKNLTAEFTQAEALVGKIDPAKFANIINAFSVPAGQADETLEHLVNTARAGAVPFNTLADAMARSGPTMSALGYSAEQAAGMFTRLYATGPQGAALVGSLDRINAKMRDLVAEGKFTTARQGWETLITAVQKFAAAGDNAGATTFLSQFVGAENAPAMLEAIKSHVVDISSAIQGMPGIGEKLSDAVSQTQTLSETWAHVGEQMRAAMAPVGMELAHGLEGASTHITEWLDKHQTEILEWTVNVTKTFTTGLSQAALFVADLLGFAAPILEMVKDVVIWHVEVISNMVNMVFTALSKIPLPQFDWARDAKKDLDALRHGLDKAWEWNLPEIISHGQAEARKFAEGTVPKFNQGLDDLVERFKAGQEFADAFSETIDGKLTNALLGTKDAQGNLIPMREDGPLRESGGGYHLGGNQANWDDISVKLQKIGIILHTNAQGMIEYVEFANTQAKKKWDDYLKALEKDPKHVPIKLEPKTPGGQDAQNSGDLVPPGQVPVTLAPSGGAATPTPTVPVPTYPGAPGSAAPAASGGQAAMAQMIYNAVIAAGYSKETAEYAVAAAIKESGLDPDNRLNPTHYGLFQETHDKPGGAPGSTAQQQISWFIGELNKLGGPAVVNKDPKNLIADKVEIGGYPGSAYDAHLGAARGFLGQPAGTPGDPVFTAPAPGAPAASPAPAPAPSPAPAPARRPPTAPAPTLGPQPQEAPSWALSPNDPRLHHAGGGDVPWLPGAERGRDSVPAVLMPGEHVWTTEEVDKAGGPNAMYGWRAAVRQGLKPRFLGGGGQGAADYAAGGRPNDRPDLVDPQLQYVMQIANQMGLTLTAGRSGHGTHDVDQGWHDSGQAADFSNGVNTDQELAFAMYMFEHFGSQLSELIYSDPRLPKLIKDGKVVDPSFYGADTLAGHRDHVHVAIRASQPLSDALQPGSQPLVAGQGGWAATPLGSPTGAGAQAAGWSVPGSSGSPASPPPGGWGPGLGPTGPIGPGFNPFTNPPPGLSAQDMQSYTTSYLQWQSSQLSSQQQATDTQQALTAAQQKRLALEADYAAQLDAWNKLSPEAKLLAVDQKKKLQEASDEVDAARKEEADTANRLAEQQRRQVIDAEKGPPQPPKGAAQKEDKDAASLGAGLVKGAFQELGFPDVFGKAFTQWGAWKAGMGVAGFLLNGLIGDQGQQAQPQGGQAAAGGVLGALFPGLQNALQPAVNAAIPAAPVFSLDPGNSPNVAPASGAPGSLAALPAILQPPAQSDEPAAVVNAGSPGPTINVNQQGMFLDNHQAQQQIRDAAYLGTAWTPSMSPPTVMA